MSDGNATDYLAEFELIELCQSIVMDGKVDLGEIKLLETWLRRHSESEMPSIKHLSQTVKGIVADGNVTANEGKNLLSAISQCWLNLE